MVLLGYAQGTSDVFWHLDQNKDGGIMSLSHGGGLDPRDLSKSKWKSIFPNHDESSYDDLVEYTKKSFMCGLYKGSEIGKVNNCPFDDAKNEEYRMDIGILHEKFQGLCIYECEM